MAIEFREGTLTFELGTAFPATTSNLEVFSKSVKTAHAVMRGYNMGFPNEDRPIHEVLAQLSGASINPSNAAIVQVSGILTLRDDSGNTQTNTDDPFHGVIDYTVIAEV